MKRRLVFSIFLFSYLALIIPFTSYLKNRPVVVKLGLTPNARLLRMVTGEYRSLLAEYEVIKVLFYFGTIIEQQRQQVVIPPEYSNMFNILSQAVKLDPYNMDAYYFSQAAFTWELHHAKDVNLMLDYGMKYRTWDYQLPFFAGFNAAYFMHDYKAAADYMKRAAQLSGNPLFTNLAARYFYESGQNRLGLIFLDAMSRSARDQKVKSLYDERKKALLAVQYLEDAVEKFKLQTGRLPAVLDELVSHGVIKSIPSDPYGGKFYIDPVGKIRTTSKFAFSVGTH